MNLTNESRPGLARASSWMLLSAPLGVCALFDPAVACARKSFPPDGLLGTNLVGDPSISMLGDGAHRGQPWRRYFCLRDYLCCEPFLVCNVCLLAHHLLGLVVTASTKCKNHNVEMFLRYKKRHSAHGNEDAQIPTIIHEYARQIHHCIAQVVNTRRNSQVFGIEKPCKCFPCGSRSMKRKRYLTARSSVSICPHSRAMVALSFL